MSSKTIQNLFINEALTAHNDYRLLHGVPPLIHNPELSKIAYKWAMNIAIKNEMQHSSNKYQNENLGECLAMWFETGAERFDGNNSF